ncbi:MAG: hypothetical protein RR230_04815 [Oscillospiraceae bacterium]
MNLKELAEEYIATGELCRNRAEELRRLLSGEALGETERLRLRRKICVINGMARDAVAVGNYLDHYYERKEVCIARKFVGEGTGIPGSTAIYQAGRVL